MSDFSAAWIKWRQRVDLDEYEHRWDKQAESGVNVHGEADLIHSLAQHLSSDQHGENQRPCSILDAGCGMGRVGIELHNRGHHVVGVDLDPDLLARAERREPSVQWVLADLAALDLEVGGQDLKRFDIVAMAGNVLPFVKAEDRPRVVDRLQRHLVENGLLVAGFSVPETSATGNGSTPPEPTEYETWCAEAGLLPVDAWSSWDKRPLAADPGYRVFVHRK